MCFNRGVDNIKDNDMPMFDVLTAKFTRLRGVPEEYSVNMVVEFSVEVESDSEAIAIAKRAGFTLPILQLTPKPPTKQ
jgi:hypothetical protein